MQFFIHTKYLAISILMAFSSQSNSFVTQPLSDNLLMNPSFESGNLTGWKADPGTTATVVSNPSQDGNYSLSFTSNGYSKVRQSIADIASREKFSVQGWLGFKDKNGTGTINIVVEWYDANGNKLKGNRIGFKNLGNHNQNPNFTYYYKEIVAPDYAVSADLLLSTKPSNNPDIIAYADNISVNKVLNNPVGIGGRIEILSATPNPAIVGNQIIFNGNISHLQNSAKTYQWHSDIDGLLSENISSTSAALGENIDFHGNGLAANGEVTAYRWRSDRDGLLSHDANFSTKILSEGTHVISFRVRNGQDVWSNETRQLVTIQATTIQSHNLLTNPGFEEGSQGWQFKKGSQHQIEDAKHEIKSGIKSLRLPPLSNAFNSARQSINNIAGGHTYRFEGWLNINSRLNGSYGLRIRWYDANGKEISKAKTDFNTTQLSIDNGYYRRLQAVSIQWIKGVVDVVAPDNATSATLLLINNGESKYAYFDDMSFRRLD